MATIVANWLSCMVPGSSVLLLHLGIHSEDQVSDLLDQARTWLYDASMAWMADQGALTEQAAQPAGPLRGLDLIRGDHRLSGEFSMLLVAACKSCWSLVAQKQEDPAVQARMLEDIRRNLSSCLSNDGQLQNSHSEPSVLRPSKWNPQESPTKRARPSNYDLYGQEAADDPLDAADAEAPVTGSTRPVSPPRASQRFPMKVWPWMRARRKKYINLSFSEFCRKMSKNERAEWKKNTRDQDGNAIPQDLSPAQLSTLRQGKLECKG